MESCGIGNYLKVIIYRCVYYGFTLRYVRIMYRISSSSQLDHILIISQRSFSHQSSNDSRV